MAKNHQNIIDAIDTNKFRSDIQKLHKKFNQDNPEQIFDQKSSSLTKTIILRIIENFGVSVERLNDPFEKFWKINRKYFLQIRKQKNVQKYLKEIEKLSNKLIEKNSFIIDNLTKIINEYTKEYGISLKDELKDFVR